MMRVNISLYFSLHEVVTVFTTIFYRVCDYFRSQMYSLLLNIKMSNLNLSAEKVFLFHQRLSSEVFL